MPPKKKQQEEEQDKLTRIAIVSTDKCKPKRCRWEIRYYPFQVDWCMVDTMWRLLVVMGYMKTLMVIMLIMPQ